MLQINYLSAIRPLAAPLAQLMLFLRRAAWSGSIFKERDQKKRRRK
jgi:hypothetical protein